MPPDKRDASPAITFLQTQKGELRESFKFIFDGYLKWYMWYIGFNLAALGAQIATRSLGGWLALAAALCVANLLAAVTCLHVLKMSDQIMDALTQYSRALREISGGSSLDKIPEISNEAPLRGVAKWSIQANAAGLAFFSFIWLITFIAAIPD